MVARTHAERPQPLTCDLDRAKELADRPPVAALHDALRLRPVRGECKYLENVARPVAVHKLRVAANRLPHDVGAPPRRAARRALDCCGPSRHRSGLERRERHALAMLHDREHHPQMLANGDAVRLVAVG